MNRKSVLVTSIVGLVLSVLALTTILLVPGINNLWMLIPEAIFIVSLVGMIVSFRKAQNGRREDDEEKEPFNWVLLLAILLAAIFFVATILVGIFAGWLALLPFIFFAGSMVWLFCIIGKDILKWIAVVALAMAIMLFGVYGIVGSFINDAINFKTLVVESLIVKDGKVVFEGNQIESHDNEIESHDNEIESHDNGIEAHDNVVEAHDNTAYVHDNTAYVHDNTVNKTPDPDKSKSAASEPAPSNPTPSNNVPDNNTPSNNTPSDTKPSNPDPQENKPTNNTVEPAIKAPASIRYGETIYVNLEGIDASNLLVSNKAFVRVDKISDSRVAITLTEDVDGYLTITDSVSRTNVVIDIEVG